MLSKFSVFVKNKAIPASSEMILNASSATVGKWVYAPGSIVSGNANAMYLGAVAVPIASAAPKKALLNASVTYNFEGGFVELMIIVHSDGTGKSVASVDFAAFFLPSNLQATCDDLEVMLDGSGEISYVLRLDLPHNSTYAGLRLKATPRASMPSA